MVTKFISSNVLINNSKVITEESLMENLKSPAALYTLLYACATPEEKAEYDTLLKLSNNAYDKVAREIVIDWLQKAK